MRQTVPALRMADLLGADDSEREATYYLGMLQNSYCHADATEQAQWFGDDIGMKGDVFDVYGQNTAATVALILRRLTSHGTTLERARRLTAFPTTGQRKPARRLERRVGQDRSGHHRRPGTHSVAPLPDRPDARASVIPEPQPRDRIAPPRTARRVRLSRWAHRCVADRAGPAAGHGRRLPRDARGPTTPARTNDGRRRRVAARGGEGRSTGRRQRAPRAPRGRAPSARPAGVARRPTSREVQVLRLLARGHPNKVIARRLEVAPKTVSNHLEHIDKQARRDESGGRHVVRRAARHARPLGRRTRAHQFNASAFGALTALVRRARR